MGVVREAGSYRASRTLLVYTSACVGIEINLGMRLGDLSGLSDFTL